MWIDDVINLEPFFSFWPVGRFWLVKTYQYGCHPSVLSHRALRTAECDESNEGGSYLVVGVCGILLPWVILRREGRHDHIWISNVLWRQFRGVCPYRAYGRGIPLYGNAATPQVFRVPKTDHSLLLVSTESIPKCGFVSTVTVIAVTISYYSRDGKDNHTFNHFYLASGMTLSTVKGVIFNLVLWFMWVGVIINQNVFTVTHVFFTVANIPFRHEFKNVFCILY